MSSSCSCKVIIGDDGILVITAVLGNASGISFFFAVVYMDGVINGTSLAYNVVYCVQGGGGVNNSWFCCSSR